MQGNNIYVTVATQLAEFLNRKKAIRPCECCGGNESVCAAHDCICHNLHLEENESSIERLNVPMAVGRCKHWDNIYFFALNDLLSNDSE